MIIFDTVELNHGNAYNKETGNFTAPLGGIYVFHLQSFCWSSASRLGIHANGGLVCVYGCENKEESDCSAIVRLERGDVINVKAEQLIINRTVWSSSQGSDFSGFSGFLQFAETSELEGGGGFN